MSNGTEDRRVSPMSIAPISKDVRQIAMADPGLPVHLWCSVEDTSRPIWKCTVINGLWDFWLDPITGNATSEDRRLPPNYLKDSRCVWAGDAPFSPTDYNEALVWIREQVSQAEDSDAPS